MQILDNIAGLAGLRGPVVLALGVFDGLHVGHLEVLSRAKALAAGSGGTAVASTFHPHPRRLLRPDDAPLLLTSLPHFELLIGRIGMEHLLVIPFSVDFAASEPMAFITSLCTAAKPLGGIVTGTDFCFGRARSGNASMLAEAGRAMGFTAVAVPPVLVDGERVSSTLVRQAVQAGDFARCERLLGRPHTVLGTVVAGRKLGRTMGFPTANLHVHNEQLPPLGVYAVTVSHEGRTFPGVANLGLRPTIGDIRQPLLEVHLLDFDGDLYGKDIEVAFVRFLRAEMTFAGLDALRGQIAMDATAARAVLAETR